MELAPHSFDVCTLIQYEAIRLFAFRTKSALSPAIIIFSFVNSSSSSFNSSNFKFIKLETRIIIIEIIVEN